MAAVVLAFAAMELWMLPFAGIALLIVSKVSHGDLGRLAERFFFAVLLLATFSTFRPLLAGDTQWLAHAVTMAIMIVGAVSVPARRQEPVVI